MLSQSIFGSSIIQLKSETSIQKGSIMESRQDKKSGSHYSMNKLEGWRSMSNQRHSTLTNDSNNMQSSPSTKKLLESF